MPINKLAYARYHIIDECLNNKRRPYPSMEALIKMLEEKLHKPFSVSQVQKDIKRLKEGAMGLNAPIKFSKRHNGYYYQDPDFSIKTIPLSEDELQSLHQAADLLKIFSGSRLSHYFNDAVLKIETALKVDYDQPVANRYPIIDIERPSAHKGFEYFELLLEAAQNQNPVSFVYYCYEERIFNAVILHTYMLKEFHNCWYVIGYSENHKEVGVFGLDRIYDPMVLNRKFIEVKDFDPDFFSKQLYGVLPLKGHHRQQIDFRVSPKLSSHFLANPLHHSQKVNEYHPHGTIDFQIEVIPTQELLDEFFRYGGQLVVLEPRWIKEEIHLRNKKAINYEQTWGKVRFRYSDAQNNLHKRPTT
jgi:predicted DNA-binding transcriptional regulator YafY